MRKGNKLRVVRLKYEEASEGKCPVAPSFPVEMLA